MLSTAAPIHGHNRWSSWLNVWTVLSLPAVCAAILFWGAVTVAGIAALVAVPVVFFVMVTDTPGLQTGTVSMRASWTGRVVLCAAMLTVSVSAIGHEIPMLSVVIVVVASVTAPPVLARCRCLAEQDLVGSDLLASSVMPDDEIHRLNPNVLAARTMSDAELCRAWRRSFWTFGETSHPMDELELVQQRHFLLDELEIRNAVALQAWLDSGPALASVRNASSSMARMATTGPPEGRGTTTVGKQMPDNENRRKLVEPTYRESLTGFVTHRRETWRESMTAWTTLTGLGLGALLTVMVIRYWRHHP